MKPIIVGQVYKSNLRRMPIPKESICVACCLERANHMHHLLPFVLGGRTMVPLCDRCHWQIHKKAYTTGELIKIGLEKARLTKRLGRPNFRNKDNESIYKLKDEGKSLGQISRELNIPKTTIHKAIKARPNS